MDDKNKNGMNVTGPDEQSEDSGKKVDRFFNQLNQNGFLEDSQKGSEEKYDPDYIDMGDYDKSDTGYVNLKGKSSKVETFNSASESKAEKPVSNAEKSAKSSSKGGKGKKKKTVNDDYKPKKKGWRIFGTVVLYIVCICIILGCAVSVVAAMYLAEVTADDDTLLDLDSIQLSYATRLMAYNSESETWEEYDRIFGGENRVWVNYEEFPQELIDAIVASEDQRFWSHKGVDVKRTVAAFINEYVFRMYDNTQGGSTITQQLIKNITNDKSAGGFDGVKRKLREIYRAFMLERKYSKEQILEAYLNTFRLSGQVAGIEAAANYYFDTTTRDLTAAQSAAIVCITKYPEKYNPFKNPDENKYQRENVVLWMMHEQGKLDDAEYNAALAESASFVFDTPGGTTAAGDVNSYFTDTTIREVLKDLQEINGMTSEEANELFYKGGLTVYLTIDPFVQETVEDVALNPEFWDWEPTYSGSNAIPTGRIWPPVEYEYQTDENGDYVLDADGNKIEQIATNQIQAAMVVMDFNGQLKGIAGGIRSKDGDLVLNRAVGSITFNDDGTVTQEGGVRQTGSSMKPIASYAPALELDKITYSSLFADRPVEVINGQPWPRNYSWQYGRAVTVYDGVRQSLNTTAASVIKLIGPEYSYDFLTSSLGITTLDPVNDVGPGMALGGLTYGCSPYEMAAAYQVFGNGGTYTTPHCYTKVTNARGEVILDKEKNLQVIKALSDDTAMIMNRILQGVVSSGTGTAARHGSLPLAGKSGTTSDNKDYWFIGMNPYYVMSCWEGYDQPEYAKTWRPHPTQLAFKEVMSRISENLDQSLRFPTAEGVQTATYCVLSGDLAGPECTETAVGYYKTGHLPGPCDHALVAAAAAEAENYDPNA